MHIQDKKAGQGDADVMAEMNATPLIDVMLVLLIMLIITIPIQNHAVVLGMQGGSTAEKRDVVTIDVDFDGTVMWNGTTMPARSNWESKLAGIGVLPDQAQPEVHLRPNRLVEYREVAAVLAVAQRAGVTRIGVVGGEQFM